MSPRTFQIHRSPPMVPSRALTDSIPLQVSVHSPKRTSAESEDDDEDSLMLGLDFP